MAAPILTTDYVIEESVVLQAGLEEAYNSVTNVVYEGWPIYDAFTPTTLEQEILEMNRAMEALSPAEFAALKEKFRAINFKTYVHGDGTVTLPAWARIGLPISGWNQSAIAGSAPTGMTVDVTQAGTLPDGTYKWTITTIDNDPTAATYLNETPIHIEQTAGPTVSKKAVLTFANPGVNKVTRIYRSKTGGTIHYALAEVEGSAAGGNQTYDDENADYLLDQTRQSPGAAGSAVIFTLKNRDFSAANFKTFYDSHNQPAGGVRGSWVAAWEAGRPMDMNWALRGIAGVAVAAANPTDDCVGPGMPPSAENIAPFLIPRHTGTTWDSGGGSGSGNGTAILPFEPKRGSIDCGTRTNPRKSAKGASSVKEIGIHQKFQQKTGIIVEIDPDFMWNPEADFDAGVTYGFGYTIGTGTFGRAEFTWPNVRIERAPRRVREDEGVACWDLGFRPGVLLNCHDYAQIRFY